MASSDSWTVDGVEYSIDASNDRVIILRRSHALGTFSSIDEFDAWHDAISDIPPVPGSCSAFGNDYLHQVAWKACLARKKELIERGMRRFYDDDERERLTREFLDSRMSREEFGALRGVPPGTLARWGAQARKGAGA